MLVVICDGMSNYGMEAWSYDLDDLLIVHDFWFTLWYGIL
jgi:hypothetical protein